MIASQGVNIIIRAHKVLQYTFEENRHKKGTFTYIRARDARAQVQSALAPGRGVRNSCYYGNAAEPGAAVLDFQASEPYEHIPVHSGRQQPPDPIYDCPLDPYGAAYNDGDRTTFDLMYHDPPNPKSSSGKYHFSLRHYHPRSRRCDVRPGIRADLRLALIFN